MASDKSLPRPEYPRPQFQRATWVNLNGQWSFTFDPGLSGRDRGFNQSQGFDRVILVPFCPESSLSGVGHTDFINGIWYHRVIRAPSDWAGSRVLLHFGGVDFESEVYIDGVPAGTHSGGSCSFCHDITNFVRPGEDHHLVVRVHDDLRSGRQPSGKQCHRFNSYGCYYTRTTGIWQTVWMEAVPDHGLSGVQILPDLDGSRFVIVPSYAGMASGLDLRGRLIAHGKEIAEDRVVAGSGIPLLLGIDQPEPWRPECPFLYDIELDVLDDSGHPVDSVKSYAGLRKVHVEGDRILLNNEPLYLRMVLDQGFYPDGVWTAPSDAALKRDIELAMQAGFNGARLHQKVFEERYHYWADRLGFLTWGESASWGMACWRAGATETSFGAAEASALNFLREWREIVCRDRNHPSIVAWTPFNETRGPAEWDLHRRVHCEAYDLTRALDPTRPVNDSSGYVHQKTDLWTIHNYQQNPEQLRHILTPGEHGVWRNAPDIEVPYSGQPYLVDEFGGVKWAPEDAGPNDREASWGYGEGPRSEEEFYERLEGLVEVLLELDHVRGYCYTQLTDVEQEKNGIYRYDRSEKFDMKRIARIFGKKPS